MIVAVSGGYVGLLLRPWVAMLIACLAVLRMMGILFVMGADRRPADATGRAPL